MPQPTMQMQAQTNLAITKRVGRRWLGAALGLIVVVAILVSALFQPTQTAELHYQGQTLHVPLSIWSTLVDRDEGSALYLGLGDPQFDSSGGFEYVEQLGSGHVLVSEALRLEIVTRKRSRWLTEVSLRVRPRTSE